MLAQRFSWTGQPPQAGTTGLACVQVMALRPRQGSHVGSFITVNPNTLPGLTICGDYMGAAVSYKGLPRTSVMLGPPCPRNLASPANIGMSSLGPTGVRLHLSSAPANTLAVLLLGLSTTSFSGAPLPLALDPIGLPGCSLRTSVELMHTAIAGTAGIASGYTTIDLPYPVPTTGQGTWSLSAQWLVLGDATTFPGGMTQALTWRR